LDVLVKRLDRIMATIENGQVHRQGAERSALFDRANKLLEQMQLIVTQVSSGKGSTQAHKR